MPGWIRPGSAAGLFGPEVRAEKVLHLRTEPRVRRRFFVLVERQGQAIDHVGTYLHIERPRRLVFTWAIRGESDEDASTVAIDITDTPEGCTLTLTHTLPARWAIRAAHPAGLGHHAGRVAAPVLISPPDPERHPRRSSGLPKEMHDE